MPRRFFKKILPEKQSLTKHPSLQCFSHLLQIDHLWHLNRRSVARGMAIGMFWTFMPIPLQIIPSTLCAIVLRGNLLVAFICIWISNPITMAPIFYFTYRLGQLILGERVTHHPNTPDLIWFMEKVHDIWWPLLTGSVITGATLSMVSYFVVSTLWRYQIRRSWKKRTLKTLAKK